MNRHSRRTSGTVYSMGRAWRGIEELQNHKNSLIFMNEGDKTRCFFYSSAFLFEGKGFAAFCETFLQEHI